MLFETGHPWLTFKDPCNLRSPQQHVGVVHSSNLCTEITLNTNKDEIAVCNLGSINLVNHIVDGKLDTAKLEKTVKTAVRMLDNVIDINYYSVPQAQNSTSSTVRSAWASWASRTPCTCSTSLRFGRGHRLRRPVHGSHQLLRDPGFLRPGRRARRLPDLPGLAVVARHPADRLGEEADRRARRQVHRSRPVGNPRLGTAARARTERHPQLEHHGHRADRDHRQHHRRLAVDRADLPEPVREVEPLRRVHRDQPTWCATSRPAACGTRSWSTT